MAKHKLRNFYLWTWLVLSLIFVGGYLESGALEGYFIAILLEILFAGIASLIPTAIYFIFTHKSN